MDPELALHALLCAWEALVGCSMEPLMCEAKQVNCLCRALRRRRSSSQSKRLRSACLLASAPSRLPEESRESAGLLASLCESNQTSSHPRVASAGAGDLLEKEADTLISLACAACVERRRRQSRTTCCSATAAVSSRTWTATAWARRQRAACGSATSANWVSLFAALLQF